MANAAIKLSMEPYDAAIARPMGRNSAGEGFLRGFLRYADADRFWFWNAHGQDRSELEALLERLGKPDRPVEWLGRGDRDGLARAGALYIPTPELKDEAWARRAFGGHAYSITGVTHTIAETQILDEIAALLLAPLEPWDALVCTSDSTRKSVEILLESTATYLQDRFGATRIPPAQLVTIPLGIHPEDFRTDPQTRGRWRDQLGIPPDAPAALFVGRFSVTAKMHPGPMGIALQEASHRLGRPVYWIVYGGARRATDEDAFRKAAMAFCPDVQIRFVDHASPATRDEIVSAADVFLSLSDNIQETFGLTPVEAMAAGLPCVVSDWDGYRDTVRHGVDGFRIRTTAPRPGLGSDLVYAYAQRLMTYDDYAGSAALLTSVDVADAADALATLFADAGHASPDGARGPRPGARGLRLAGGDPAIPGALGGVAPPAPGRAPAAGAGEPLSARPLPHVRGLSHRGPRPRRHRRPGPRPCAGRGGGAFAATVRPPGCSPPAEPGRGGGDSGRPRRRPLQRRLPAGANSTRAASVRGTRYPVAGQVRTSASARRNVAYLSSTVLVQVPFSAPMW